jgi:PST family polysaccharide transporter
MSPTNLKERAVKGSAWSAVQALGGEGLSFLVFLVLARLLSPQEIGLVALAGVLIAFLTIFVSQGLVQSLVQKAVVSETDLDTAFWANVAMAALLAGLSVLAAPLFASFYDEPRLADLVRWLSLGFLFGALSGVQEAQIQRNLDFKQLAMRKLVGGLSGGVVGITLAVQGFGVWSLVAKQLVEQAVGVVVLWRATGWRPGRTFSMESFRTLFGFGSNVLGIRVINFVNMRADAALIGYFLGAGVLGYYTVAQRLLEVIQHILLVPSQQVALPVLSKLQNDPERLREVFYKASRLTGWVAIPGFLGVAVLAPEALTVFFGEKWLPSVEVLQVLTLVGILQTAYQFNGPILMAIGKPSWVLGLRTVSAVANVAAIYLAVPWGIVAVAWAFVIRGYLLAPLPLLVLKRTVGVEPVQFMRQLSMPLLASLGMVGTLLAVKAILGEDLPAAGMLAMETAVGLFAAILLMRMLAPGEFRSGRDLVMLLIKRRS